MHTYKYCGYVIWELLCHEGEAGGAGAGAADSETDADSETQADVYSPATCLRRIYIVKHPENNQKGISVNYMYIWTYI